MNPEDKPPVPLPAENELVCGRKMTIAPQNYYAAEFCGQVIYFCTEFCLESFKADPERFFNAHSKNRVKTAQGLS